MTRIVSLSIRGRVQGVGYRVFLRDEALALGLGGWVRNRRDGTVEALLGGPPEAIARLVQAARAGPPGAAVDAVEEAEAPAGTTVAAGIAVLSTE
ncbi:MAG TPA: acylphosphatase [Hyphomicrobiales bacterium]|nr:acylphosphatase [Hyphomicrobiales bacterium]